MEGSGEGVSSPRGMVRSALEPLFLIPWMLCPKVAMDMDCRTPLRVVSIGFVSSAYDRTCTGSGGGRGPSHPGGSGVGGSGKPGPPYFSTSMRVRC